MRRQKESMEEIKELLWEEWRSRQGEKVRRRKAINGGTKGRRREIDFTVIVLLDRRAFSETGSYYERKRGKDWVEEN